MTVVRANRPATRMCIGITFAGLLLAGCTPAKKPVLPQPPPTTQTSDRWGTEAAVRRVHDLSREADNLASDSKTLPGHDAADHSRVMQRVFTDLMQSLSLIGNPVNDAKLRLDLTTIQTARAQLASGSTNLRVEPTIDNSLRTAAKALADLSHGDDIEGANVGPLLDKLSAELNRLDLSEQQAALHRVDVAEAVDTMSQVVTKMSEALSAKINSAHSSPAGKAPVEPAAPTTEPAAQPNSPAAPASEPTAPAKEGPAPAAPAAPATAPSAPATPATEPAPAAAPVPGPPNK